MSCNEASSRSPRWVTEQTPWELLLAVTVKFELCKMTYKNCYYY